MCVYGTPRCNGPDREHTCRPDKPRHDSDVLQDTTRKLALADMNASGVALDREQVRVLCKVLGIASVLDGAAIYYVLDNPTLTGPKEDRVRVIRAGEDTCEKCGGALTPSNRSVHEAGECGWPTPKPALPNRPVPFREQTWNGGKAS